MYENEYPELEKDGGYTSPASSLPLHELKMLQEYIHGVNLQNLGAKLPHYKQQMILLKFFKMKKNQLVEVYSRNGEEVIHTIGKVNTVGRNFVMLKTLFTRIWIPYAAIHSAKSPFGIPDVPNVHQHNVIDVELRRKLLVNFGEVVSGKEELRQQFYEELLETNLKSWKRTNLTIYADKILKGQVNEVLSGKISLKNAPQKEIPIIKINYIKQTRLISFFQRIYSKWFIRNR
jgi:hypothetical protein